MIFPGATCKKKQVENEAFIPQAYMRPAGRHPCGVEPHARDLHPASLQPDGCRAFGRPLKKIRAIGIFSVSHTRGNREKWRKELNLWYSHLLTWEPPLNPYDIYIAPSVKSSRFLKSFFENYQNYKLPPPSISPLTDLHAKTRQLRRTASSCSVIQ